MDCKRLLAGFSGSDQHSSSRPPPLPLPLPCARQCFTALLMVHFRETEKSEREKIQIKAAAEIIAPAPAPWSWTHNKQQQTTTTTIDSGGKRQKKKVCCCVVRDWMRRLKGFVLTVLCSYALPMLSHRQTDALSCFLTPSDYKSQTPPEIETRRAVISTSTTTTNSQYRQLPSTTSRVCRLSQLAIFLLSFSPLLKKCTKGEPRHWINHVDCFLPATQIHSVCKSGASFLFVQLSKYVINRQLLLLLLLTPLIHFGLIVFFFLGLPWLLLLPFLLFVNRFLFDFALLYSAFFQLSAVNCQV